MSVSGKNIVGGVIFLLTLSMWSCSTEKDAALNVGYHNMTARYNGYFNARILMQEALDNYRAGTSEDYTKILPIDLYPSKEDVPKIQDKYEVAFEKCEKVIFRHSMPTAQSAKKKKIEHCRWIDDNWFVIGQIHYTRQEYEKAIEIFNFIQESPLYADQERVHEARIWLAKTYIATKNYPEAKRYLSLSEINMQAAESEKGEKKEKLSKREKERRKKQAKKDKKNGVKKPVAFPKHLKDDYQLTMAEFHIEKGEYKKAIDYLERGIDLVKKKKRKARYQFVLAQLYQQTGNGEAAAQNFQKVVKSPAPYEMRFQAQINRAISATGGGEVIRKELAKMLKDAKNLEYKDQIYFALAEMDMKDGEIDAAVKNYGYSAFFSVKNDRQKGVSYLKLGDIHFDRKDYLSAQKYYDSCIQVLPEEYETYEQIAAKAEGLSGLVDHYETYVYEDSVQRIVNMPESEREKFLESTLKELKEREKQRKIEEQKRLLAQQNRVRNAGNSGGSGSKWYFYNQKISSSGFNDFRANWGQRVLEDDWRRSTKTSYSTNSDDPDSDSTDVDQVDLDDFDIDSLTVDMLRDALPLEQADLDSSQNRLMNSLYMLGIIYKESLKEPLEAERYFELCVNRGVNHPKVLPAMYQLYLLNKKKGSSKAEGYKQTILKDHPASEIANIIQDPDYLKKQQEREQQELNAYAEALEHYRYRRYNNCLADCNQVIARDRKNQFLNKYYLLKAFAIGKLDGGNKTAISSPLEELFELDPDSEEGQQAKMYLNKLAQGNNIVSPDTNVAPQSPYLFDENIQHYFLVIHPNDAGNLNNAKIKVANFNQEFYRSKRYQTTNAVFGSDNQVLLVRSFPNLDEAKTYQMAFESNSAKPSLGSLANDFEHYMISAENFKILFETMDLKSYQDFYKDKYP